MPGKQDKDKSVVTPDETEEVTVTIAGETWALEPLVGLKSFHVVPRFMRIASKLTYAAGQADIDLAGLFGEEGFNIEALKVENLLALDFIGEVLVDNWPEISQQIVPLLLNQKPQWLWNNGTFIEHMRALWAAVIYHAPSLFGEPTWQALKKSLAEQTPEEKEPDSNPETPSESNEV